jgi:hypothetical protein
LADARRKLLPDVLASADERSKADEKTVEQARAVRGHARALSAGPKVSTRSWVDLRKCLGETQDRVRALGIVSAATGYDPLPKQLKFHLAAAPGQRVSKFFCGGIGTGKSTCAMVEDIIVALCNPGTRALVVAPTYDQALHVLLPIFLRICEQMERAGFPILRKFRWSQMRAELVCGGEFFFRSVSKVDNLLGFEFALIHFDESETVAAPERIWAALDGRMRQVANWREMIGTSTPRGLRGVLGIFHAAREDYKTPEERELRRQQYVFIRATTLDNPHLPPDYIENLRRTLSVAAWRQEVMAEILKPEAAVYGVFERRRHAINVGTKAEWIATMARTGTSYDLVYDFGPNYSHILWIATNEAGVGIVFDELCEDGMSTQRIHQEIITRCNVLGRPPDWIVCDRAVMSERRWAAQQYPQSYVQIMDSRSEQSILEGIAVVTNLLDPMVGDPKLRFASYLWDQTPRRGIVKCMALYRYQMQVNGLLGRMPWKDNQHDHGCDDIRMWSVKRHGDSYRTLVVSRKHGS